MATIKIPGVKSTVSTTNHVVTFTDGIVINLTGSNTIATRKAAYEKAYELANPVVAPPITPPVIIIPPSNGIREISRSDYNQLSDIEGESFVVKASSSAGAADHTNLKDVTIDLSRVQVVGGNQALRIHGLSVNVAYNGMSLKNVEGYQIECVGADKVAYRPGVEGTFIDRLAINGFTFDGGGRPFHADGNVRSKNVHDGVIKGFQFSSNKIMNNLGSKFMVYLGNGFDFNIFSNSFTNINKENNEDNGMFYLKATGKLYNNIANNYQGYLARIWLHSIDGLKTVEVFNNLGYDGDKYGLIELQLRDDIKAMGAQPANAKVHNNTAINLNKSNDWGAEILTLYNTYDTVEYYDNLGAQLVGMKDNRPTRDAAVIQGNNMVFGQYGSDVTKLVVSGKNLYFDKAAQAVDTNLKSLHPGVGAQ